MKPFRIGPNITPVIVAATALLALACAACLYSDEPSGERSAKGGDPPAWPMAKGESEAKKRLREGTRLTDVVGRFDVAGDRVTFTIAGRQDSFRALENLSLERVTRVLGENRDNPQWVVSGLVTEYGGANYLLLSKAVIQSKGPVAPREPLPRGHETGN